MTANQTIDGVPREFVREGRYIVVKPDYEDDLRTERLRNYIEEMCFHTPDCVVVEADWPEYEKVWGMIEARVTGRQTELDSALATIAHLRDDLDGTRLLAADQLLKINRLKARISELEAAQPQGEPVADVHVRTIDPHYPNPGRQVYVNWRHGQQESIKDGDKLYAQPPAPVSDLLEQIERLKAENKQMIQAATSRFMDEPAPVAVVLPERRGGYLSDRDEEWNACLDEIERRLKG